MKRTMGAFLIEECLQPALLLSSFASLLLYHDSYGEVPPHAIYCVTISVALVLFGVERIRPFRKEWKASVEELLVGAAVWGPVYYLWAPFIFGYHVEVFGQIWSFFGIQTWCIWPNESFVAKVGLAWVSYEFMNYTYHRLAHKFRWLWVFASHGAHHSPHKLNMVKGLLNHPVEQLLMAIPPVLLMQLLGADGEAIYGMLIMYLVQVFIVHSNVPMKSSVLRYVFTTPMHHRMHHSDVLEAQNSNFCCTIILVDRLFGTCREDVLPASVGAGISPSTRLSTVQQWLFPLRPAYADPSRKWPETELTKEKARG